MWHSNGRDLAVKWDAVRAAAEDAGRDPDAIVRATSLSISEGWDDVRRTFEGYRDAGVTYLVVSWPGQGRGRVEEFVSTVVPTLG